ncbi:amino acid ABC transporter substrate-binding protein [Lyngbya confervoides]|uniref:Amino acid ABC transporter substrate-binding protein n=1 Tax=Lyngbya confervoides BDU141951 TaxID=1574623 RepID=A0ABD4T3L5_9CYAN|nr:amino acid ABC transporter substrate-binding protein [Lyngbya confervoides]MCM1983025.1 amino acid ABC transporter substrate-binding protein [Lyngbya confervoides BDU141951]
MLRSILGSILVLATPGMLVLPAPAQPLMEKIAETGVLVGGTSKDAFPYAYRNEEGELVGYSVDMMQQVRQVLETQLQRPVQLRLVPLASDQRIPKLEAGKVDLVCDASSFTWDRDQRIDFSVSYGITGTRLLVPANSVLSNPESLAGKRIGALPKTTNEAAVRRLQPEAKLVLMRDRASGYQAVAQGEIDAFADDGILLESWLQRQPDPSQFRIASYPYSKEGIACMLPENHSDFQDSVNLALVRYMQGFLEQKPEYQAVFDRWFGPEGAAPMTRDLRNLSVETMQLILDFKEELPEADL